MFSGIFWCAGKRGKIIVRLCLEDAERMFGKAALGAAHPDRGRSCLSCSGLFERRGETELRSVWARSYTASLRAQCSPGRCEPLTQCSPSSITAGVDNPTSALSQVSGDTRGGQKGNPDVWGAPPVMGIWPLQATLQAELIARPQRRRGSLMSSSRHIGMNLSLCLDKDETFAGQLCNSKCLFCLLRDFILRYISTFLGLVGSYLGVFLLMQSLNLGNWLYFLPFPGSNPLC